jgi:hypothetical protein
MLWSAPVVGLLALPTTLMLWQGKADQPLLFAYLAVMGLAGTWTLLTAEKVGEGKEVYPATRRLIYLVVGLVLGAISLLFDQTFRLGPVLHRPAQSVLVWNQTGYRPPAPFDRMALEPFLYFGGLFLANNWTKLTARDRKARFRVWPIVFAGLLGAALTPIAPYPEPVGVAVGVIVAVATQLASPWNQAAARYARYRARNRRWVA